MATLTKEEFEQMAELLSRLGNQGTNRHRNLNRFDQGLTQSKKGKERDQDGKNIFWR